MCPDDGTLLTTYRCVYAERPAEAERRQKSLLQSGAAVMCLYCSTCWANNRWRNFRQ